MENNDIEVLVSGSDYSLIGFIACAGRVPALMRINPECES